MSAGDHPNARQTPAGSERSRELVGKVALVTGGGRNIGRAIALELARRGASVVVNAHRSHAQIDAVAHEIARAGGSALPVLADVADAGQACAMVAAAIERFGRLDVLVNNAAVRREAPFGAMSAAEWRDILATILDGAFHCAQAALPHLRASGAGAIVNIGGLTGHSGARHRVHVVAAKAGLVGFTKALAHELAADGITVNCVSPGLIDTARGEAPTPAHHATAVNAVGRRGTVEEVADAVAFLCGPRARYITGQTLHVNGGAWMGAG